MAVADVYLIWFRQALGVGSAIWLRQTLGVGLTIWLRRTLGVDSATWLRRLPDADSAIRLRLPPDVDSAIRLRTDRLMLIRPFGFGPAKVIGFPHQLPPEFFCRGILGRRIYQLRSLFGRSDRTWSSRPRCEGQSLWRCLIDVLD